MESSSRYRLTRLIKRGGMAELYEGVALGHGGFERKVAIKRLLSTFADDQNAVDAFIDEANIVANLHHANVVSVVDFGLMQGVPFQVLEFIEGYDCRDLLTAIDDRGLVIPPEIALHVCAEIANALAYVHSATDALGESLHVVHRDVSLSNVLVSVSGDVKLTDFGIALAQHRRNHTQVGTVKGKLNFMSPEQYRSEQLDGRSDLFSLGCVLHALITGVSPLDDEGVRKRLFAGEAIAFDSALPPDIAAILAKACIPRRAARYASARDMAEGINVALGERVGASGGSRFRAWIAELRSRPTPKARSPLSELVNVDLVLETSRSAVPRVASQMSEPSTDPRQQVSVDPVSADGLVGTVLGNYEVRDRIGRGGFGVVYRGADLVFRKPCAIKVLHAGIKDTRRAARFSREIKALESVAHPNLISILDSGTTPTGRPYLVTELVDGPTLKEAVKAGAFSEPRAIQVAIEIARGLGAMHALGIVHRDLSPKNVMLSNVHPFPVTKILDFGIARLMDTTGELTRLTEPGRQLGTPRWMPPEQFQDSSTADPRADLYTLGLLIYFMVTGEAPFDGTVGEIMWLHLHERAAALTQAPQLDSVVGKLLEKAPENRYQSAEALLEVLEALDRSTAVTQVPDITENDGNMNTAVDIGLNPSAIISIADLPDPALRNTELSGEGSVSQTALLSDTLSPVASEIGQTPQLVVRAGGPDRSRLLLAVGLLLLFCIVASTTYMLTRSEERVPSTVVPPAATPGVVDLPRAIPGDAPEPEKPVSNEVAPRKRAAPPARAPRKSAKHTRRILDGRIAAALRARGLKRRDMMASASLAKMYRAYDRAARAQEMTEANRIATALSSKIGSFEVDAALIRARLDGARKRLQGLEGQVSSDDFNRLERRYLDLRQTLSSPDPNAGVATLQAIRQLERQISSAQ